ncbi:hypothetical protein V1517DRAFT_307526 [Lipomyces orientalis]|uniref:Uncharacterized protein n=1 Tax=Lipomyces orientalis TaxID=1233043 RepID=A0ACC3TQB3_9ASCO
MQSVVVLAESGLSVDSAQAASATRERGTQGRYNPENPFLRVTAARDAAAAVEPSQQKTTFTKTRQSSSVATRPHRQSINQRLYRPNVDRVVSTFPAPPLTKHATHAAVLERSAAVGGSIIMASTDSSRAKVSSPFPDNGPSFQSTTGTRQRLVPDGQRKPMALIGSNFRSCGRYTRPSVRLSAGHGYRTRGYISPRNPKLGTKIA